MTIISSSLELSSDVEQSFDTPHIVTPAETFGIWAAHPDERIAAAGERLRAKWYKEADSHLLTAPLMVHAKRCWREHYPNPSAAGALIYDVASLARHIKRLEARIAELEGGAND